MSGRHSLAHSRLQRVPLVKASLESGCVCWRPIDKAWFYEQAIPISVSGFNPFSGKLFVAKKSWLSRRLANSQTDDRSFNPSDFLVTEALFLAHDYLHMWAVSEIQSAFPEIGFGTSQISTKNLEDMVFCQLVTEAVATVGLDYWYLCTINLDDVIEMGSDVRTLTVSFHEESMREYRRFAPSLEVQHVRFFSSIAQFYCTGEFKGIEARDLQRSPKLLRWLSHELRYGRLQRVYSRQWFRYLGGLEQNSADQGAPVRTSGALKKSIVDHLGAALWKIVKDGHLPRQARVRKPAWRSRPNQAPDFRFFNISADGNFRDALLRYGPSLGEDQFDHLWYQYISHFQYEQVDEEKLALIDLARRARNVTLVDNLTKDLTEITAVSASTPHDLLLLN